MRLFAHKGYFIGLLVSLVVLSILSISDLHHLRAPGENNTGHENLDCIECHEKSTGSIRQQVQANLSYLIGRRTDLAAFNFDVPGNKDCIACHERENDNHPIYRFNEPRFLEARKAIQPQFCNSCHKEHSGVRVTSKADNCQLCHEELLVKDDPIEVPHSTLIKDNNWESCLGCHDFHGNHEMSIATRSSEILDGKVIDDYFHGGDDPYSSKKISKAKETRNED